MKHPNLTKSIAIRFASNHSICFKSFTNWILSRSRTFFSTSTMRTMTEQWEFLISDWKNEIMKSVKYAKKAGFFLLKKEAGCQISINFSNPTWELLSSLWCNVPPGSILKSGSLMTQRSSMQEVTRSLNFSPVPIHTIRTFLHISRIK